MRLDQEQASRVGRLVCKGSDVSDTTGNQCQLRVRSPPDPQLTGPTSGAAGCDTVTPHAV